MQCVNPSNYLKSGLYNPHMFPCGKCLACNLSKQSEWASRLVLEYKLHESATFFTLTYSDKHLPSDNTLQKRDIQLFIKRWNKNYGYQPRYFVCGEYGGKFGRPHYHGIFFGDSPEMAWTQSKYSGISQLVKTDRRFDETWKKGITYVKDCGSGRQAKNILTYVAAYVLKKNLTSSLKENLIPSEHKREWALMSRKPYLGSGAVNSICDALTTRGGAAHLAVTRTCPNFFTYGGRRFMVPLRIRKEVCKTLDIEFLHYQPNTGEIEIDENGMKVLKSKHVEKKTFKEAQQWLQSIEQRIESKQLRQATRPSNPALTA